MPESLLKFPSGKMVLPLVLRSRADVGQVVREQRHALSLRQIALAGIGNTGTA